MTTMKRSGSKRSALLGVGLVLVLAATAAACAPTPPSSVGIRCEPVTARVAATPAITFDTQPVELNSLGADPASPCADSTGRGITSVRFKAFSVAFPATSCLPSAGTSGIGSATVVWSDGSTSQAAVLASYDGPFSGTVQASIIGGTFKGFEGNGQFWASPTAGSCYENGVTRADVNVSIPQLSPPPNG